jgi:hypothetical protein
MRHEVINDIVDNINHSSIVIIHGLKRTKTMSFTNNMTVTKQKQKQKILLITLLLLII